MIATSDVAHALLGVPDQMIVIHCNGQVSILELLDKLLGDFLAGDINLVHGMGECISLEDRHSIRNALSALSH